MKKKQELDYYPLESPESHIFFHEQLHMEQSLSTKFHQNPLSSLEVVLTRNVDRQTNWGEGGPIHPLYNFVVSGITNYM